MASQTITLLAAWFVQGTGERRWVAPEGSRPVAVDALKPAGVTRVYERANIRLTDGQVNLSVASSQTQTGGAGHDLSAQFELTGKLTFTQGTNSFTALLAGADMTEPYTWIPSNSADAIAFYNALDTTQDVTLTIDDGFDDVAYVSQTLQLPAVEYFYWAGTSVVGEHARWQFDAGERPQIDGALTPANVSRFLVTARFFIGSGSNSGAPGQVELRINSSQSGAESNNEDLSAQFELTGRLTITAGTNSLTAELAGADLSEPYVWTPSNSAEVIAFADAMPTTSGTQAATLKIENREQGTTTDTDSIYQLGDPDTAPAMPTGGMAAEAHTPAGWTRTEPSPTETQAVWRSQRTRTFNGGTFASATAWGAPEISAAKLLALADFNTPAGMTMHVLALIETGTLFNNEVFDTDDNRGSLIEGDNILENVDSANNEITIGRLQVSPTGDIFVLNRRGGNGRYDAAFGQATDSYNDATIYVQVGDTVVEIDAEDMFRSGGIGFVQFGVPASDQATIAMLRTPGTRFILGLGMPAPPGSAKAFGALRSSAALKINTLASTKAFGALGSRASLRPASMASAKAFGALRSNAALKRDVLESSKALGGLVSDADLRVEPLRSEKAFGPLASVSDISVEAPVHFEVDDIAADSVVLTWDARPEPGVTGYQYRLNGGAWVNTGSVLPQIRITGLTSGTGYRVEVRATGDFGFSNPTPALSFTTVPLLPPGVPQRVRTNPSGGTIMDLAWNKPLSDGNTAITHYEVRVIRPDGTAEPYERTSGTNPSHRVRGLAIGHRYGFQVRAVNGVGPGESTDIVYAVPEPPLTRAAGAGFALPLLDADRQAFVVRLGGQDCRLIIWRQPSDGDWYASLETPVNTVVVAGRRLATNAGLLDRLPGVLAGNIVCRAIRSEAGEPGVDAWRQPTHALVWEPET